MEDKKTLYKFIKEGIEKEMLKSNLETGVKKGSKEFIESASDREIQDKIYLTLRRIENSSDKAVSKLSIIAGIAIVYFVCSILAVIIILSK